MLCLFGYLIIFIESVIMFDIVYFYVLSSLMLIDLIESECIWSGRNYLEAIWELEELSPKLWGKQWKNGGAFKCLVSWFY